MVSLLLHCIIMIIASIFYTPRTQTNQLKDAVTVEILSPIKRRLPLLVSRVRPMNEPVLSVETVQMQPRITTHAAARPGTSVQPQTVLEFSNKVAKLDAPINPNVPKAVGPTPTAPSDVPASTDSGLGGTVQVKVAFERPAGLAMVEHIGAPRDASGNVVENVTLGSAAAPPLKPRMMKRITICISKDPGPIHLLTPKMTIFQHLRWTLIRVPIQ